MDIVLGVSMTPTTVRMVLVEGEKADGVTVDHDVFDITAIEGSATSSAADQVIAAVLGTQESAAAGGHHLKSIGVTWTDHGEAAALRDALAARGIDDVMLVSATHAAGAARPSRRPRRGLRDHRAALHRPRHRDPVGGADRRRLRRQGLEPHLHGGDAMAVLTEMAAAVDAQDSPPQGMFVVGSGVDVSAVKAHLENLVSCRSTPRKNRSWRSPVARRWRPRMRPRWRRPPSDSPTRRTPTAPPPAALCRACRCGHPDGPGRRPPSGSVDDSDLATPTDEEPADEGRKPFLLVGSALTSIFVVGVVALVISLAVSIRPTVDQRPSPGQSADHSQHPGARACSPVQLAQPDRAAAAAPRHRRRPSRRPCRSCRKPRAQAPPRTVFVEQPAPRARGARARTAAPHRRPVPAAPPVPIPPLVLPPPIYNPPVYYRRRRSRSRRRRRSGCRRGRTADEDRRHRRGRRRGTAGAAVPQYPRCIRGTPSGSGGRGRWLSGSAATPVDPAITVAARLRLAVVAAGPASVSWASAAGGH